MFNIRKERETCTVRVHVLAAMQWFGLAAVMADGIVVRHLNGDPGNNRRENLALGTMRDNSLDRPKVSRLAHGRKAARVLRAVSDEEAMAIRDRFRLGEAQVALAESFGLAKSTVNGIVRGYTYKEVGRSLGADEVEDVKKAQHAKRYPQKSRELNEPKKRSKMHEHLGSRPPTSDKEATRDYMSQYMTLRYHERRKALVEQLGGKCVMCSSKEVRIVPTTEYGKEAKLSKRIGSISEKKLKQLVPHHELRCKQHTLL